MEFRYTLYVSLWKLNSYKGLVSHKCVVVSHKYSFINTSLRTAPQKQALMRAMSMKSNHGNGPKFGISVLPPGPGTMSTPNLLEVKSLT